MADTTDDGIPAPAPGPHRPLPPVLAGALADFLTAYGVRGVGEIDLGRTRWREDPTDLLATLARYLEIPADQTPPVNFRRGEQRAAQALDELTARLGTGPRGRMQRRVARWAASRVRALAGGREAPKFTIIQAMGILRPALLATGADLVAAGILDRPEDVFLLRLQELLDLPRLAADSAGRELLRERVGERAATRASEARRTRVPRVLCGDGRVFYEGLGGTAEPDDEGVITGSPVSPGRVEGLVRVVLDPATAELQHGEILVCPGTDPAWTPLFLSAGGLVTEVGGMMTHGSVVAREYGIPAVVGVHEATTRLRTGQRIRLDGGAGTIVTLAEPAPTQ